MLKKHYFLTLLLCTTRLAWAGPAHEMAAHLLDRISEQKNFQATFTYQIQPDQGEASGEELTGSITVQGSQYHLVMGGQEVMSDGTTVWNYLADANEVQINDYNPEEEAGVPWLLFANWRKTHQFYSLNAQNIYLKQGGYYKCKDGTYDIYHTVTIAAKSLKHPVQEIVVMGNRDTHLVNLDIKRLEALDNNRQRHIFSITKFETALVLEDAYFKFIPENYVDIEVIDMRE